MCLKTYRSRIHSFTFIHPACTPLLVLVFMKTCKATNYLVTQSQIGRILDGTIQSSGNTEDLLIRSYLFTQGQGKDAVVF